jgi:hypothetical protein
MWLFQNTFSMGKEPPIPTQIPTEFFCGLVHWREQQQNAFKLAA